jgi:hypothetical protein
MRYPHLVVAAVASSAPVRASLAMPGYDAVVGEALAEPDVGGSETCLWVVARAFGEVARLMLERDGRRRLETMFNVCSSASSRREPRGVSRRAHRDLPGAVQRPRVRPRGERGVRHTRRVRDHDQLVVFPFVRIDRSDRRIERNLAPSVGDRSDDRSDPIRNARTKPDVVVS